MPSGLDSKPGPTGQGSLHELGQISSGLSRSGYSRGKGRCDWLYSEQGADSTLPDWTMPFWDTIHYPNVITRGNFSGGPFWHSFSIFYRLPPFSDQDHMIL